LQVFRLKREAVEYLTHYEVAFTGLKIGTHTYGFLLDEAFFKEMESEDIAGGKILVDMLLEKKENMLVLDFSLTGTALCFCDRCGEEYSQPLEGKHKLVVSFGKTATGMDDDVVVLDEKAHSINLRDFLYETSVLVLPLKKIHADRPDGSPGCDPDILKILEKLSPKNETDPRWNELNKLL
jgi:uncharacterized protein